MSDYRAEIGKVTRTFLGIEDHGILTFSIQMDFGPGGQQGVGGFQLDEHFPGSPIHSRRGLASGMEFVRRLLLAFGVRSWEQVAGRTVYVLFDGRRPVGIRPLPTETGTELLFAEVAGV